MLCFLVVVMVMMAVIPSATYASSVSVVVLAPRDDPLISYKGAVVATRLAFQNVLDQGFWDVDLYYIRGRDWTRFEENLSGARARGTLDVIIGPAREDYVARVAGLVQSWGVPVISVGPDSWQVNDRREQFPMLTQAGPLNGRNMADALIAHMRVHHWNKLKLISDEGDLTTIAPRYCSNLVNGLRPILENHGIQAENHTVTSDVIPVDLLRGQYSVILLCAKPEAVRQLLIEVHTREDFTNGDYVFINVDPFPSTDRPWFNSEESPERNEIAANAFQAVHTLTERKPASRSYQMFSYEVKRRVMAEYASANFGEGQVNNFVGCFHDAAVLYALSLNETREARIPKSDGAWITSRMRGRTFQGITGTVSIDANGDRLVDYSILTMNPYTNANEVAANYFANQQMLEPVANRRIHWAGGRDGPPPDSPSRVFT